MDRPTHQIPESPDGVRRLAVHPTPDVLDQIAALVPEWDGSDLTLIRTKYKPSRNLTATYELPGEPARHVAVIWTNDGVQVFASPHDPAMPHVAALHDPAHLAGLLGFGDRVETLRYRPGQRHVLRVTAPGRTAYVKVDKDDSGARAVPFATTLGPRVADLCPGALLAEPIGWSAPNRAGLWLGSPGESLRTVLSTAQTAALVRLVGAAVRVLHETPLDLPGPGQSSPLPRDVEAEVASTVRAGEHIVALLPDVGADFTSTVADVAERLAQLPTEPARFTHGDLKSDNVLAHDGTVRLLDLDRSGLADPALDLAKFVSDLHWWQGAGADSLVAAFRDGYGDGDPARWERAAHLTRLFQLKLTARRCAVHDPAWESDVRARVAASPVPALDLAAGGAR